METNLGTTDRLMRASIGILVLVGVLISPVDVFTLPALYYGAIVVGIIALLNSMTGMCIVFRLIGVSTCPLTSKEHE